MNMTKELESIRRTMDAQKLGLQISRLEMWHLLFDNAIDHGLDYSLATQMADGGHIVLTRPNHE